MRRPPPRSIPASAPLRCARRLSWALALLGAACGSTPGAAPVRPQYDLHHPSATRRLQAVSQVAASRETQYVPDLILLLDDEDEGVRFAAGATLRDLTGRDTGYRASDPEPVRAAQLSAWQAWWRGRTAGTPPPPVVVPPAAPSGGTHAP